MRWSPRKGAARLGACAALTLLSPRGSLAQSEAQSRPLDLPAGTLLFHRSIIKDIDGTGLDAYTITVPIGWRGQCNVLWNPMRRVAPSDLLVRVSNPQGGQEFNYYPSALFVWTPKLQEASAALGGWVEGCRILQPPDGPLPAIQKLVIPDILKDLNGKYNVVSSKELPQLAAAYAPTYARPGGPQPAVRAGKVRVEYEEGGRTMQQDVYCALVLTTLQAGSVWSLDHLMSFKEEKGLPDQTDRQFAIMAASLLPTAKFLEAQDKMTAALIQQANQFAAAQIQQGVDKGKALQAISQDIMANWKGLAAQVGGEEKAEQDISQDLMANWRMRQQAEAGEIANYGFGDVHGVVTEKDAHTGDWVPVPDDYTHVWSAPNGDLVYTSNNDFKPATLINADWREMKPAAP